MEKNADGVSNDVLGGPTSVAAFNGESPKDHRNEIQKDLRGTINLASSYCHCSRAWLDRFDTPQ